VSGVLVVAGVAVLAFACLGVLAMPEPLGRLHYVSVGTLGLVLVVAAVLVDRGASFIGLRALFVGAFAVVTGPVLSHVAARAIHERSERRR
jgi:multicomponent Na+:H+ antiporter subunit G